jgi:hypothetical protein
MDFELLTKDEAAEKTRITRRYLDMRIAAGTGPEVVHIGRRVLVRSDALQARAVQRCCMCCTEAALLHTRGEVGV